MRLIRYLKFKLLAILIFFSIGKSFSQNYVKEIEYITGGSDFSTLDITVPVNSTSTGLKSKVAKAFCYVYMDMLAVEDRYIFGDPSVSPFDYTFQFTMYGTTYNDNSEDITSSTVTLPINNDRPQAAFKKDITQYLNNNDHLDDLENVYLQSVGFNITSGADLTSNVRISLVVEIEYAYDVTIDDTDVPPAQPQDINIEGRIIEFNWNHNFPYTFYQLQLMKLYNNAAILEDGIISITDIDWSNASVYDIHIGEILADDGQIIYDKSFELTMQEGSGIYVWRIRPVGSFYDGGKANALNYGNWSNADASGIITDAILNNPEYFWFDDPDDGRNRIYGRVFAEDNKVKETAVYADGLQNTRQTQTFLPSEQVTIINQTIQDHLGRNVFSTLPMPVKDRIDNYNEGFVRVGQKLYTADEFSDETDGLEPSPVNETSDMNYYNNNFDQRIPDAEGYPFSYQVYYEDPLNRIKEESGPGEIHTFRNDQTGHTVKYFYGMPSETELIRIFGREAPHHENVTKMVKVDQNNVATITYTSSEGKVLATCLTFFDNDDDNLELIDYGPASTDMTPVTDRITRNMNMNGEIVSAKRVVLLQPTEFLVDYRILQQILSSSCASVEIDCHFTLDINIINVKTGIKTNVQENYNMDDATVEGDYLVVNDPVTDRELEPGTYIIEKRLYAGDPELTKSDASDLIRAIINPIPELIALWLDEVNCPESVPIYYDRLDALKEVLHSTHDLDGLLINIYGSVDEAPDFIETFMIEKYDPAPNDFDMDFFYYDETSGSYVPVTGSERPEMAKFTTTCCPIKFPVKYIPEPDLDTEPTQDPDNNGEPGMQVEEENYEESFYTGTPTDYIPDFEGYAYSFFADCPELQDGQFYQYMDGWYNPDQGIPKGTFNLMIYHMLTDEYEIKNAYDEDVSEEDEVYEEPYYDECGNLITHDWENHIYDAEQLFECWVSVLGQLKNQVQCDPADIPYEYDEGPVNVANSVDNRTRYENDDNEDPSVFNKQFDEGLKDRSFIVRWLAKRKLSKKMRDLDQEPETQDEMEKEVEIANIHLVESFLECTGYQFAKILTPYKPFPKDNDRYFDDDYFYYTINVAALVPHPIMLQYRFYLADGVPAVDYFDQVTGTFLKPSGTDYYYIPLSDWEPRRIVPGGGDGEILFENIKNPIYAFKYFEYKSEGKPGLQPLEASTCYDDPNDCFLVDNNVVQGNVGVGITKVPCCAYEGDDPETSSSCYGDDNYPHYEGTKWLVSDYEGKGRLKCEYTSKAWSSGQRYAYYLALKNYVIPSDEWVNEETVLNCEVLGYDDNQWWHFPGDDNVFVPYNPNVSPIIDFRDMSDPENPMVQIMDFPDFENPLENRAGSELSFYDWQLSVRRRECLNRCKERRVEFYSKIENMLLRKCYQIDACMDPAVDNTHIIPREDIDTMVNKLEEKCAAQCMEINTYSCAEKTARKLRTLKTDLGPNVVYYNTMFGMGGIPGDHPKQIENGYVDATGCTESSVPGIYSCDMENYDKEQYSWYQYTLLNQATSWDFDVDLPSKCTTHTIQAEQSVDYDGVVRVRGGMAGFHTGDYIMLKDVDFGTTGPNYIFIRMSAPATVETKRIQIRQGSVTGTIIAQFQPPATSSINNYSEFGVSMTPITGMHDIYITGEIISGGLDPVLIGNIDFIRISDFVVTGDNPNGLSNSRSFDNNEQDDTFLDRGEYEKEISIGDPTKKEPDDPVRSPGNNVNIPYEDLNSGE